jgi:uncharacterized protein (DUF58 family)
LLKEVRRIEVQTNRLVTGVLAGGYASVFRGRGIEFEEVREYVDGDDPRSVDWNVTARVGRPYVKQYVDERELTVLFLLDVSRSMDGGFGVWSARQTAARVCACFALAAVKNNDRVGLIAFSDKVEKLVPPAKGSGHALRIVRDCLALPSAAGATDIGPALGLAARAVRSGAVVFILSDFLMRGWRKALSICARRHDVIAVRLLAPELAPPPHGLVQVVDPETRREMLLDWRSRPTREAYLARVAAWKKDTAADLRRARVDLMDVHVPRSPGKDLVARPILRFFRMRELRSENA